MATKAYVVDKDKSGAKLQVRIPTIDGVENSKISPVDDSYLSWASIECTPGINIDYQVGDVVWVEFEDNELDQPVVTGYSKLKNKELEPNTYMTVKSLTVTDKFVAPMNTTIGKTSYTDIYDMVDRCQHCPFYFREGEYYVVNFWLHPPEYSEEEEPYATVYVPANNQSRVKIQELPPDPDVYEIIFGPDDDGDGDGGGSGSGGDGGSGSGTHPILYNFDSSQIYNNSSWSPGMTQGFVSCGATIEVEFCTYDGYHFEGSCVSVGSGGASRSSYTISSNNTKVTISITGRTDNTNPIYVYIYATADTGDDSPDSDPAPISLSPDGIINLADDEHEGEPEETTFNGWYWIDHFGHYRLWDFNDNVYSDLDLFAMDYYTVTFQVKGSDYDLRYVLADKFHRVTPPENPSIGELIPSGGSADPDSENFIGWFYTDGFGNDVLWDFDKYILDDTILYPLGYYTVTFTAGNDEQIRYVLKDGIHKVNPIDDPDTESLKPGNGYLEETKFNGWYYTDEFGHSRLWDFDKYVTDDLALSALGYYTVSFTVEGEVIATKYVLKDNFHRVTPIDETPVNEEGEEFDGWYYTDINGHDRPWDFYDYIIEDIVLFAHWEGDEESDFYPIYWNYTDCTPAQALPTTIAKDGEESLTVRFDSRNGYYFNRNNAYSLNGSADINLTIADNTLTIVISNPRSGLHFTILAVEDVYHTMNYHYNWNGEYEEDDIYYTEQIHNYDYAVAPEDPPDGEKANFAGWFITPTSSTLFNFTTPITEDTDVFARWGADMWTVTFISFGEVYASQRVSDGELCTDPGTPTPGSGGDPQCYYFLGWVDGSGETWDFNTPITENTSIYANWLDFEDLSTLIDEADKLNGDEYTAESWGEFQEALTQAKDVLSDARNGRCTQTQIDNAWWYLWSKIQVLVPDSGGGGGSDTFTVNLYLDEGLTLLWKSVELDKDTEYTLSVVFGTPTSSTGGTFSHWEDLEHGITIDSDTYIFSSDVYAGNYCNLVAVFIAPASTCTLKVVNGSGTSRNDSTIQAGTFSYVDTDGESRSGTIGTVGMNTGIEVPTNTAITFSIGSLYVHTRVSSGAESTSSAILRLMYYPTSTSASLIDSTANGATQTITTGDTRDATYELVVVPSNAALEEDVEAELNNKTLVSGTATYTNIGIPHFTFDLGNAGYSTPSGFAGYYRWTSDYTPAGKCIIDDTFWMFGSSNGSAATMTPNQYSLYMATLVPARSVAEQYQYYSYLQDPNASTPDHVDLYYPGFLTTPQTVRITVTSGCPYLAIGAASSSSLFTSACTGQGNGTGFSTDVTLTGDSSSDTISFYYYLANCPVDAGTYTVNIRMELLED